MTKYNDIRKICYRNTKPSTSLNVQVMVCCTVYEILLQFGWILEAYIDNCIWKSKYITLGWIKNLTGLLWRKNPTKTKPAPLSFHSVTVAVKHKICSSSPNPCDRLRIIHRKPGSLKTTTMEAADNLLKQRIQIETNYWCICFNSNQWKIGTALHTGVAICTHTLFEIDILEISTQSCIVKLLSKENKYRVWTYCLTYWQLS